ncbi:hypothetical protein BVI1335_350038 [Burkholderia vietnamiensis]|nr:hypothetical protein BVI1335_350038 [Burkholderia vietnamiensis]
MNSHAIYTRLHRRSMSKQPCSGLAAVRAEVLCDANTLIDMSTPVEGDIKWGGTKFHDGRRLARPSMYMNARCSVVAYPQRLAQKSWTNVGSCEFGPPIYVTRPKRLLGTRTVNADPCGDRHCDYALDHTGTPY